MTPRTRIHILVAIILPCVCVFASGGSECDDNNVPETAPAADSDSQPKAAATSTAPVADPDAKEILDALEKAGEKHKNIRADLDYMVLNKQLGDMERRTGWVAYRAAQKKKKESANKDEEDFEVIPAGFRIHFKTLQMAEGPKLREEVDYAFDGRWLTVAKHRIRQMTRYQVAAKGETVEPFRLGRGPFPLPFGQKTREVVKYFKVTTRPAKEDDPENTDYLKMIPRPFQRQKMGVTCIEMWISTETHLPVKIFTTDESGRETTAVFSDINTDAKQSDDVFHLPRKVGWQYHVETLQGVGDIAP